MAAERKRRPERLGSLVTAVLEHCGVRDRVDRAATAALWAERAGSHIARVTRVSRVRGTTLFVEVTNPAWLTELDMMKRTLLRKLNADRERGTIERIVFVQGGGADSHQPRKS